MYSVEQIAVFLENEQGTLNEFAKILSDNAIDLISLTLADTREFGIVRIITSNNKKALAVLRERGFIAKIFQVLCISVPDEPGGIYKIFDLLERNGISIEYTYSLSRQREHSALIILKVDDSDKACRLFAENGVKSAENMLN